MKFSSFCKQFAKMLFYESQQQNLVGHYKKKGKIFKFSLLINSYVI